MGVRKIPPAVREKLRLIDIRDFDLNACGGTHVHSTGQIGAILLRKTEKVKQGVRVEFVCGLRAVATARRDFQTLTEAASVFSAQLWEVPQQARKSLDDVKAGAKGAAPAAGRSSRACRPRTCCAHAEEHPAGSGQKLVAEFFADRDLDFIKMLAQRLIRQGQVAVFVGCGGSQPSLVFAQTPGLSNDMGALMKDSYAEAGHSRRRQPRHGAGRGTRRRRRRTGRPRSRKHDRIGQAVVRSLQVDFGFQVSFSSPF